MLVHSVYFWLPESFSEEEKAEFVKRVEGLASIPGVVHGFCGTPAETTRAVIDDTYSCALTLIFEDMDGHDVYQQHEIHSAFLKDFASRWERVLIYDAD